MYPSVAIWQSNVNFPTHWTGSGSWLTILIHVGAQMCQISHTMSNLHRRWQKYAKNYKLQKYTYMSCCHQVNVVSSDHEIDEKSSFSFQSDGTYHCSVSSSVVAFWQSKSRNLESMDWISLNKGVPLPPNLFHWCQRQERPGCLFLICINISSAMWRLLLFMKSCHLYDFLTNTAVPMLCFHRPRVSKQWESLQLTEYADKQGWMGHVAADV